MGDHGDAGPAGLLDHRHLAIASLAGPPARSPGCIPGSVDLCRRTDSQGAAAAIRMVCLPAERLLAPARLADSRHGIDPAGDRVDCCTAGSQVKEVSEA